MTTNAYITLQDSSGSGGNFAVAFGGYTPVLIRNQDVQDTLDGGVDVSQGGIIEQHQYTVKTRHTEDRIGYGTLAELERSWRLNNPNGTPSDKITLIDHYGNSHTTIFIGQFPKQPLTTIIEGSEAWFFIPVTLRFLPV